MSCNYVSDLFKDGIGQKIGDKDRLPTVYGRAARSTLWANAVWLLIGRASRSLKVGGTMTCRCHSRIIVHRGRIGISLWTHPAYKRGSPGRRLASPCHSRSSIFSGNIWGALRIPWGCLERFRKASGPHVSINYRLLRTDAACIDFSAKGTRGLSAQNRTTRRRDASRRFSSASNKYWPRPFALQFVDEYFAAAFTLDGL